MRSRRPVLVRYTCPTHGVIDVRYQDALRYTPRIGYVVRDAITCPHAGPVGCCQDLATKTSSADPAPAPDATRMDWLDGLDDALIDGGALRLEMVRERMLRTGESTRQAIDWFRQQEHDRRLQGELHATH